MKKRNDFQDLTLSFISDSDGLYSAPVNGYFEDFPYEIFEGSNIIQENSTKIQELIEALDNYFETHFINYQFPSGFISVGHNSSPEINFDKDRIGLLRNGFIPVLIRFFEPNFPLSRGFFSWTV